MTLPLTTELVQQLILDSLNQGFGAEAIMDGAQRLGITPVLLAQSVQAMNPSVFSGAAYDALLDHIKKRYKANAAISGFVGFTGEELTPEQRARIQADKDATHERVFGTPR
jgi:hypothetical protein